MKLLPVILLFFFCLNVYSQQEEFYIEAQIVDNNSKPLGDVYILNYRNLDKAVSKQNGVFNMWVLPSDSLMISHVSYNRRIIRVFDILVNPIVCIEMDTINIMQVDILANPINDYDKAKKNIESINFSLKPPVNETFTEKELVQDMLDRENKIMKSEAHSLKFVSFSPTVIVGLISKKIKRRKKSNQFSSRKKKPKKNYPATSE